MATFGLVVSLHCRQLFPRGLVEATRCVNIHPGFNPHNRGQFPHVYSMLDASPAGVTIHLMDERIDHGPIIYQQRIDVLPEDTSETLYSRIIGLEMTLLRQWLPRLIAGDFSATPAPAGGSIHSRSDFDNLCRLDLNERSSVGAVINRLRALTFEGYENAYFLDHLTGDRVFVSISLKRERKK